MAYKIRFSEEKNQVLRATRGVSFEEIKEAIAGEDLLANIDHTNAQHSHQKIYVVKIKNYVFAVLYVIDEEKQHIFLKTAYPSRSLKKLYLKGKNHDTQ